VLIVLGVGLLGVAFVAAFLIVRDPGASFDRWVPAEDVQGPEASFTWASSDRRVELSDTSSPGDADLVGRVWDFGDGTASEEPNPVHEYGEDGEYTIRLEVTDTTGQTSRAEAGVGVQAGTENSGQGELGLTELADSVTATVERLAKGIGVVLLVIGLFVVMVMAGGRLLKHGVRALRPIPERISIKVRPRELEREVHLDLTQQTDTATTGIATERGSSPAAPGATEPREERETLGV
jgi:hypothetical protein